MTVALSDPAAAALAQGQIGPGQLKVITDTMAALPASVPEPARERVEADLANYARDFDPRRLRIIAQRMLDVLDPDGPAPAADSTPTADPSPTHSGAEPTGERLISRRSS